MNDLTQLNDDQAIALLQTLARADIDFPHHAQSLTPLAQLPLTPSQQADLARTTLLALAEQNPQQHAAITNLLNTPPPRHFDAGATIATLIGVAVLLRTHIKFKRNTQGKWELLIEHKPADNSLLKILLEKLQNLLDKQ